MTPPRLETRCLDDPAERRDDIIRFLADIMEGRNPLPTAPETLSWYYSSCPAGNGFVTLVVDTANRERIAGFSGVCRLPWSAGGMTGPAGRIGPVFIHPEYRRQGAYSMLRTVEDQAARSHGLPVLFCTPNRVLAPSLFRSSFRVHQRFGIFQVPVRVLNRRALTRPLSLLKQAGFFVLRIPARRKFPSHGVDIRRLDTFGDETDEFWSRFQKSHFGIPKNAEYLKWRYVSRPNTSFRAFLGSQGGKPKVLCVIEWRRDHPQDGWIAELLAEDGDDRIAAAVVAMAERAAAGAGVNQLIGLADGVSITGAVINEMGYYSLRPRRFMIKVLDESSTPQGVRPWNFSAGDYLTMRRMV